MFSALPSCGRRGRAAPRLLFERRGLCEPAANQADLFLTSSRRDPPAVGTAAERCSFSSRWYSRWAMRLRSLSPIMGAPTGCETGWSMPYLPKALRCSSSGRAPRAAGTPHQCLRCSPLCVRCVWTPAQGWWSPWARGPAPRQCLGRSPRPWRSRISALRSKTATRPRWASDRARWSSCRVRAGTDAEGPDKLGRDATRRTALRNLGARHGARRPKPCLWAARPRLPHRAGAGRCGPAGPRGGGSRSLRPHLARRQRGGRADPLDPAARRSP